MIQLTLSDEQARLIAGESSPIVLVDSQGRPLGQVAPIDPNAAAQPAISAEEWTEIKRRIANDDGKRFSLQQIKERLRSLE